MTNGSNSLDPFRPWYLLQIRWYSLNQLENIWYPSDRMKCKKNGCYYDANLCQHNLTKLNFRTIILMFLTISHGGRTSKRVPI